LSGGSVEKAERTERTGRQALRAALDAALDRVDAQHSVEAALDAGIGDSLAPIHVLALGKAAAGMARAVHVRMGAAVARGLVVTKDGHSGGFDAWPVLETSHPVPDARCAEAGRRVLAFAAEVPASDTLLVLLSGGTSALLATPIDGLELEDLVQTNELLLASGAPIEALNTVRKRLAAVSAGRLAAATGAARIRVLVVSDVVGDDLAAIASGPCAPDPTGFADALDVVQRAGVELRLPPRVRAHLESGVREDRRDAPAAEDAVFERVDTRLVARNADAVASAAESLRAAGARVVVLGDRLTGEACVRGAQLAALAEALAKGDVDGQAPIAFVVGGETTVTLGDAPGQGGRNQELALAAAKALAGADPAARPVTLLAAGTDGTDGPTDAAGGLVDRRSVERMAAVGFDAAVALARHDAHGALDAAGDLLRTGPTGTNVMDLALVWIDPAAA